MGQKHGNFSIKKYDFRPVFTEIVRKEIDCKEISLRTSYHDTTYTWSNLKEKICNKTIQLISNFFREKWKRNTVIIKTRTKRFFWTAFMLELQKIVYSSTRRNVHNSKNCFLVYLELSPFLISQNKNEILFLSKKTARQKKKEELLQA